MTSTDAYGSGSIITPEAVVLDFELAGLASRSIAYGIDFAIQFLTLILFVMFAALVAAGSELVGLIFLLVGLIVIVLGYATIMETFNGGRTLGRMVVKTRVVTVEGAPVRFRQAFIRALLGIIDLLLTAGTVAVVTSLLTKRGQRLGDLVAGTMVIREPSSTGPSGAIHFYPPQYLAAWSQTVDTRALGNDAYQLVRDFLTRPDIVESERVRLAEDVALLVSERLPHAARPPAVPAMDYLSAIATATQGTSSPGMPPPPQPRGPAQPQQSAYGQPAPTRFPPPPGVRPHAPSAAAPVAPQRYIPQPATTQPATPNPAAPEPPPNDGGFTAPG